MDNEWSLQITRWQQTCTNIWYESFIATAYPMEHKSSAGQALKQFIYDFGIPDKLVCDGAAGQVGKRTEFQGTVQKHAIDLHVTKPRHHNQSKV